jgi:Transposase DDE domain group 1
MLGGTHNFCGILLSWSAVGHQLHAIAEHMAHIACAAHRRPVQHRRGIQHEVAPGTDARHHSAWRLHEVLVEQFIASFKTAPAELVLDFDATDNPLYGQQESRFFHGY